VVPLNAGEQQLLALVDGQRTVAELAAAAHLNEFDATKTLFHLAEAGYVEAAGEAGDAKAAGGRVEAVAEVLVELLQLVAASVPAEEKGPFLAAVRAFAADPAGIHAPLLQGATPADDGAIDRGAFLERLAALPDATVQRLHPAGDRRALAVEALRELLFFYLFAIGGRIPKEEDEFLASELKRRLATVDGRGE
jgi:hypothetical protein